MDTQTALVTAGEAQHALAVVVDLLGRLAAGDPDGEIMTALVALEAARTAERLVGDTVHALSAMLADRGVAWPPPVRPQDQ